MEIDAALCSPLLGQVTRRSMPMAFLVTGCLVSAYKKVDAIVVDFHKITIDFLVFVSYQRGVV